MALNDIKEYDFARNTVEATFCSIVNSSPSCGLSDAIQLPSSIDVKHSDCLAYESWTQQDVVVDAKHIKAKNFSTGKYSISGSFIEFFKEKPKQNHRLAFMLVEDGQLVEKFLYAKTLDVINNCDLEEKKSRKNGKKYYLVNIDEVKSKCKHYIIQKDK